LVTARPRSFPITLSTVDRDLTLRDAALANGVSEQLYDRVVVPMHMTRLGSADVSGSAPAEGGGTGGSGTS
jgi:fumarate hydratase class II